MGRQKGLNHADGRYQRVGSRLLWNIVTYLLCDDPEYHNSHHYESLKSYVCMY